jgi:hypothetical protein
MPVHDWTRVTAGIFHHFHHRWIAAISDSLNAGLLPSDYHALSTPVQNGTEAVGQDLPVMPVFLEPGKYINLPLEATYQAAFQGVSLRWRRVLEG